MVQFSYLRLYLGIETVSRRLLRRMARMDMDWNMKKLGQLFQVFMLCLQKNTTKCLISTSYLKRNIFCVGKGTKWWLWHRIDLKQQYPRDIAPLTLLSPNSDWTNINFLLTISRDCQEQSLWELIKWSQREKSLIFYQILPTNSLNEMYGDQSAEFVYGSWGLTG